MFGFFWTVILNKRMSSLNKQSGTKGSAASPASVSGEISLCIEPGSQSDARLCAPQPPEPPLAGRHFVNLALTAVEFE